MNALGVQADSCIAFEDSRAGIISAQLAGVTCERVNFFKK